VRLSDICFSFIFIGIASLIVAGSGSLMFYFIESAKEATIYGSIVSGFIFLHIVLRFNLIDYDVNDKIRALDLNETKFFGQSEY